MSKFWIDVMVAAAIFCIGLAVTIRKFAGADSLPTIIAAVLTPVLAPISLIWVIVMGLAGKLEVDPCPIGLEEAERAVEIERQKMFGGPLREPTISVSWRLAYQRQLERETEIVRDVARRYLVLQS